MRNRLQDASAPSWDLEPVMELWIRPTAQGATVRATGALSTATAATLTRTVENLARNGCLAIRVDLRPLGSIDAAALDCLERSAALTLAAVDLVVGSA